MALIRHIALIANNPGKLADFYTNVFNMTVTETGDGGDVWLSDGYMGVALFPKSGVLPKGIHHYGFTLSDGEKPGIYDKLAARDCRPFDPGTGLLRTDRRFGEDAVNDSDDNRIDLVVGADPTPVAGAGTEAETPKIKHIAFFVERPDLLAEFYCDVFGMTLTGVTGRNAHWVTDGYVNVALLFKTKEKQPKGINHFGFIIQPESKPHVYGELDACDVKVFQPAINNDRPFVEDAALDPEGNRFDISTAVREIDAEMARPRTEKEMELVNGA